LSFAKDQLRFGMSDDVLEKFGMRRVRKVYYNATPYLAFEPIDPTLAQRREIAKQERRMRRRAAELSKRTGEDFTARRTAEMKRGHGL
jgi:hypothetical protein